MFTSDSGVRRLAIAAPTPIYPARSLANNVSGVVVAAVEIELAGRVRRVRAVESPDDATARAVETAVRRWTFKPMAAPARANLIAGNLVFYFHIVNGRGVVSSPEELKASRGGDATATHRESQDPVILDVRGRVAYKRSHRAGAVNIPLDELPVRALELPRSRRIVLECLPELQSSQRCDTALRILKRAGFSDVAAENRGGQ